MMSKRQIVILIAVFALLSLTVGAVLCFAKIHPPKDRITDRNYPPEFICDSGENRIDFQTGDNCAAYAASFVLRSLGKQTDGERIAPEMGRIFGFVSAGSIVRVFETHGFSAKAYHGDVDTLKHRLVGGVPVIVFLSIPNDTHYAVAVGYDTQYFYLVDSLSENKNADASVRKHPIKWSIPTCILYGENDNLTSKETIYEFTEQTGATLTVMNGGEHCFHTDKQMKFLNNWIRKSI